ncbi:hypothetical protein ACFYNN_12895 [Streptomyces sp. NPDC006978]|uniref:hypothetical protein n=1 Tax=Streptomyces sp. NPDC006978 TaxID=3364769 RepID=UPI0036BBFE91
MPRIRILQSIAAVDFSWVPGELVDVDAATAQAYADGVRAELAEDTVPAGAEKAAARSRGGGRSRRAETR